MNREGVDLIIHESLLSQTTAPSHNIRYNTTSIITIITVLFYFYFYFYFFFTP